MCQSATYPEYRHAVEATLLSAVEHGELSASEAKKKLKGYDDMWESAKKDRNVKDLLVQREKAREELEAGVIRAAEARLSEIRKEPVHLEFGKVDKPKSSKS